MTRASIFMGPCPPAFFSFFFFPISSFLLFVFGYLPTILGIYFLESLYYSVIVLSFEPPGQLVDPSSTP